MGRKALFENSKTLTIKLEQDLYDQFAKHVWLKQIETGTSITISTMLRELISKHVNTNTTSKEN